jgi:hypothetical protein
LRLGRLFLRGEMPHLQVPGAVGAELDGVATAFRDLRERHAGRVLAAILALHGVTSSDMLVRIN